MAITARPPLPDFLPVFRRTERTQAPAAKAYGVERADELVGLLSIKDEAVRFLRDAYEKDRVPRSIRMAISWYNQVTLDPGTRYRIVDVSPAAKAPAAGTLLTAEVSYQLVYNNTDVLCLSFSEEDAQYLFRCRGFVPIPDWMAYLVDKLMLPEEGTPVRHADLLRRSTERKLDLG